MGDRTVKSIERALLVLAAAVVVLLSMLRVGVFWRDDAFLDMASGVWVAHAVDLADGTFYRPVVAADGYGGSRYFPLQHVAHAGLIKVTGSPIGSGHALLGGAILLLLGAAYRLLKLHGAATVVAASGAVLILASQSTQEALLAIKGDALPAALNLLGVALCASGAATTPAILGAAAVFALAFAGKVTAVSGLAAAAIWLWLAGHKGRALKLLAYSSIGMAALIGLTALASNGGAMRAWSEGGANGIGLAGLIRAPFNTARAAREVPETMAFFQLGLAAWVLMAFRDRLKPTLSTVFFATTAVVTVVIFAVEGSDTNHLLDLQAASILVIGAWIASEQGRQRDFAVTALAVAGLAASLSLASGLANRRVETPPARFREVVALVPDRARPILAENPLVPIIAGQRPYMLDAFIFRMVQSRDPSFADQLWRDLAQQRFAAVVLERDPHTERGERWYRAGFFGDGFIRAVEERYEEVGRVGPRVVYRPRLTFAKD
jgi:hypothetical protein